jgi:hypothetical protein
MKKSIIIPLVILVSIPFIRCSSDSSSSNSNAYNQSNIYGWWYPNANTSIPHYKAYYFGEDGVYKQKYSNTSEGIGTWVWESDSVVKMTPTVNGGIAGGQVTGRVYKLSQDTLVLANEELRMSRIEN